MIYEWSCDNEDCSDNAEKKINTLLESVLSIPGINTILKYIKIYKKSYFKLYYIYIYIYIYIYKK